MVFVVLMFAVWEFAVADRGFGSAEHVVMVGIEGLYLPALLDKLAQEELVTLKRFFSESTYTFDCRRYQHHNPTQPEAKQYHLVEQIGHQYSFLAPSPSMVFMAILGN